MKLVQIGPIRGVRSLILDWLFVNLQPSRFTFIVHILRLLPTRLASLKMARGTLEDRRGHGKTHWKKIWRWWA